MTTITVDTTLLLDGENADSGDVILPINNLKTAVEDTLNGVKAFDQINIATLATLTIASGAITVTGSYHKVDTQAGDLTDDLDTINGGVDGDVLILSTFDSNHDVVVRHNTGNIRTNSGNHVTLSSIEKMALFFKSNGVWVLFDEYVPINLAAPGPIGATTPSTGNFTAVTAITVAASTSVAAPALNGKLNATAAGAGSASANIAPGSDPSTPAEGDVWIQDVLNHLKVFLGGRIQNLPGVLFTQTNNASSNATAETTIMGTGEGSLTLPAGFLTVGKTIRVVLRGIMTTTATASNVTFRGKLGSVNICASVATANTVSLTNVGVVIIWEFTCRSTGATGTVRGQGTVSLDTNAAASNVIGMTSTADVTIDTTAQQTIDTTLQISAASATTITITNAIVEVLN